MNDIEQTLIRIHEELVSIRKVLEYGNAQRSASNDILKNIRGNTR